MTREEIEKKIVDFMTTNFELENVTASSKFEEDLGLDSIDAVELALELGEMTGAEIKEDALRKIVTVSDVVDLVLELQSGKSAPSAEDPA